MNLISNGRKPKIGDRIIQTETLTNIASKGYLFKGLRGTIIKLERDIDSEYVRILWDNNQQETVNIDEETVDYVK